MRRAERALNRLTSPQLVLFLQPFQVSQTEPRYLRLAATVKERSADSEVCFCAVFVCVVRRRWGASVAVSLAVLVGVFGLAACGGGSRGSGPDTSAAEVQAEVEQAEVEAQQARAKAKRKAERRREREAAAERERREQRVAEEAELESREAGESEEATASECDPNYAGACLDPNAVDYDCAGGSGDGPEYTGPVTVVGSDHYGLDRDGDGYGCES